MITLKHGVQALLGSTLVCVAACGGAASPGDMGGAAAGGSTAASAGATASGGQSLASAGSYSESGSVGIANGGSFDQGSGGLTGVAGTEFPGSGGDTSTGGAPGAGGFSAGGMSGVAGGAVGSGGANSCPAAAPTDRSMCTTATAANENCLYVGESCACRAAIVIAPRPGGPAAGGAGGASTGAAGASTGAGGAAAATTPTWRCTGSGAACPATVPTTGGMCTNPTGAGAAALDCPYPDGKTCRCTNKRWECTEPPPPACPTKQPTGACTAIQSCNYGTTAAMRTRCECDGATWACDMAGGAAPKCTAKAPAALASGDACTGIGACPVTGVGAAAATCVCDGKTVTCN